MIGCIAVALAEMAYLMIRCIVAVFPGMAYLLNQNWGTAFFVVVCVLVALEACYSQHLLKRMARVDRNLLKFRLIEISLLLVLIKIGSYVGDDWNDILSDIRMWPHNPMLILSDEVLIAFALALISWMAASETIKDLDRLKDPPRCHHDAFISWVTTTDTTKGPDRLDGSPQYHRDEDVPRQNITLRFFAGSILLFISTGVSRLSVKVLLDRLRHIGSIDPSRPSAPGLVLNILIYFLLGLILLGQVQYTTMHRRWRESEVKVTQKLGARWARYGLIFIGLVSLVAFLIPTGYTMGFLETAGSVFTILAMVLRFTVELIIFLVFLLPLWLLRRLFGGDTTPPSLPAISDELKGTQVSPDMGALPWVDVLRSVVFWLVALGVVFYVVRRYLRDHPEIQKALSSLWLFRAIGGFLTALWRRLTGLAGVISGRIPHRLSLRRHEGKPERGKAPRFFRLGALSPRERTLYYYLSILRRAGQHGFQRKGSQTPYEYDATLEPHLPQARQEMELLTGDFVEARYSPHPIDREKEKEARARWKKVRAAVRGLEQRQTDKDNGALETDSAPSRA
jgi:hypothetical protein